MKLKITNEIAHYSCGNIVTENRHRNVFFPPERMSLVFLHRVLCR